MRLFWRRGKRTHQVSSWFTAFRGFTFDPLDCSDRLNGSIWPSTVLKSSKWHFCEISDFKIPTRQHLTTHKTTSRSSSCFNLDSYQIHSTNNLNFIPMMKKSPLVWTTAVVAAATATVSAASTSRSHRMLIKSSWNLPELPPLPSSTQGNFNSQSLAAFVSKLPRGGSSGYYNDNNNNGDYYYEDYPEDERQGDGDYYGDDTYSYNDNRKQGGSFGGLAVSTHICIMNIRVNESLTHSLYLDTYLV